MRVLIILLVVMVSGVTLAQGNVTEEVIVSTVGGKSIDEIISSTDIVEHEGLDRNINSNSPNLALLIHTTTRNFPTNIY